MLIEYQLSLYNIYNERIFKHSRNSFGITRENIYVCSMWPLIYLWANALSFSYEYALSLALKCNVQQEEKKLYVFHFVIYLSLFALVNIISIYTNYSKSMMMLNDIISNSIIWDFVLLFLDNLMTYLSRKFKTHLFISIFLVKTSVWHIHTTCNFIVSR